MEVRAEAVGNRIVVVPSGRFPGDVEMSKSVPGGRWNKTDKYWHYPLTWTSCLILRQVYTDMLVLGPRLTAWGASEKRRNASAARLSKKMDTPLRRCDDIAPTLAAAMGSRTYQRVGARFLGEYRSVLLADEPTLGKTIQYLGGIIEGSNEVGVHLVVAPKSSLRSVWAEEVFKWTPFHAFWMPDGRAKRERMIDLFMEDEHPSKFLCINPEMLQVLIAGYCKKCDKFEPTKNEASKIPAYKWWPEEHFTEAHNLKPKIKKQEWPGLFEIDWASICIDEAHQSLLGNRGANNKTQAAQGLDMLRLREGGMKIASTGTPLKGRPTSFWSIFNWLRPETWPSKWQFASQFQDSKPNQFTSSGIEFLDEIRSDREEMLKDALKTIMLRRTKKEVQPDLPDDMTINHWVELTGKHLTQYSELVDGGETEIEGGAISIQGVLAEMTRRKQFAFGPMVKYGDHLVPDLELSPKFLKVLDLLERRGVTGDPKTESRQDGGWKYIIGSQFTSTLNRIEQGLHNAGIESLMITGQASLKQRDRAVAEWQTEEHDGAKRVLLINTMAGGTALTLDAMCDEMFILDETWVSDEQFQLEGRIRNRNPEKRVAVRSYHYIRTRGTIEEEIAQSGLTQDEFQKKILDRSRGHNVKSRSIK